MLAEFSNRIDRIGAALSDSAGHARGLSQAYIALFEEELSAHWKFLSHGVVYGAIGLCCALLAAVFVSLMAVNYLVTVLGPENTSLAYGLVGIFWVLAGVICGVLAYRGFTRVKEFPRATLNSIKEGFKCAAIH